MRLKIDIYINKIIEDTGLTKKEIQQLVTNKKDELKGLISDEGALFIIAKELGVDVKEENKDLMKDIEIYIKDIIPNMRNIVLIGRIKEIYKLSNFNRKDGSIGQVGSFLLNDNTGDIRVVLWDEHVKVFENPNFDLNELVKIINGYAKKGKQQGLEIHVGKLGKIEISPEDIDFKKVPLIKSEITPINNINLSLQSVSIEGKIMQKYPIKEFVKKNGEPGKVASFILMDSTGSIRVTFWNEDTSKLEEVESNDYLMITNLNPRLSNLDAKTIQLYANNNSSITKKEKELKLEENLIERIDLLQNTQNLVTFQGIITSVDNLKNVSLKTGEEVPILSFFVSDETDAIRVTLWRENAENYSKVLKSGAGILLKNVMPKYNNFSDRKEISFIPDSSLEIVDLDIKNVKNIKPATKKGKNNITGNYTRIDEINSPGIFEIKGFFAKELNNVNIYKACSTCLKKIDNCKCDPKGDIVFRMIFNAVIDDGSATIRTTFIGDVAEKLLGEKTEELAKIKETPNFDKFLEEKSAELLGKDIVIRGKAKFSDFSSSYELVAYDFKDVNITEDLEKTIKEIEI